MNKTKIKKQLGIVIPVEGDFRPVESSGDKFTLAELQGFVGGMIELVYTTDGREMYINEEGKIDGLPFNPAANDLYGNKHDLIVGDAIVITPKEVK